MRRRALLSTAAAGITLFAGCGADGDSQTDQPTASSPAREQTPGTDDSAPPATPTPTPTSDDTVDTLYEMRNTPEADKHIRIENRDDVAHTVTLTVTREATDTVVYEGTYDLSPGEMRVPYNVAEADPDGIETFSAVATLDGNDDSRELSIRTSACYGTPTFTITDDGRLRQYYSIC